MNVSEVRKKFAAIAAAYVGVKEGTAQHHAIIDDGCDYIDYLGGSETGIRDHGDTEKQRFPVLHTFSISISRNADYVVTQSNHKEF